MFVNLWFRCEDIARHGKTWEEVGDFESMFDRFFKKPLISLVGIMNAYFLRSKMSIYICVIEGTECMMSFFYYECET